MFGEASFYMLAANPLCVLDVSFQTTNVSTISES